MAERGSRLGVVALVALVALGAFASAASAEPLSMTFTEARANVGVQLDDEALFKAPDTAPFDAQIDPGSGAITAGYLEVPDFVTHITAPIDADVTVSFDYDLITGSFDAASGALTLSGETNATLKSSEKECTISTTPAVLTLTSAGNSGGTNPRSGTLFTHGLTGPGAIAGQWTDMHATPVDPEPGGDTVFCEDVEDQIGGAGGIWLEQEGDLIPPSAPQLTRTDPADGGTNDAPRILGTAEAGSTVRIYSGADCSGTPLATGSAADLGSPGIGVKVDGGSGSKTFSATATDAAGNVSACSAPISYNLIHGDPGAQPCVVPKLAGKKLARAKAALWAAGCTVGKTNKTKGKPKKGMKVVRFVVKSSSPAAGTVLPFGGKVNLKLEPKLRKARH